eukprot:831728-Prymnesium_polylepis.1
MRTGFLACEFLAWFPVRSCSSFHVYGGPGVCVTGRRDVAHGTGHARRVGDARVCVTLTGRRDVARLAASLGVPW